MSDPSHALDYAHPPASDWRTNRWKTAYRWTLAYFAVLSLIGVPVLLGIPYSFKAYHASSAPSAFDRLMIELATSAAIPAVLFAAGLAGCGAFRRAHLCMDHRRALWAYVVVTMVILALRAVANVYVIWIARLTLSVSGRPYRWFHWRDESDVVGNIACCVLLAVPAFVTPFMLRRPS